jgi:hypothetical protein
MRGVLHRGAQHDAALEGGAAGSAGGLAVGPAVELSVGSAAGGVVRATGLRLPSARHAMPIPPRPNQPAPDPARSNQTPPDPKPQSPPKAYLVVPPPRQQRLPLVSLPHARHRAAGHEGGGGVGQAGAVKVGQLD